MTKYIERTLITIILVSVFVILLTCIKISSIDDDIIELKQQNYDLKHKLEDIECILDTYENMHADHYAFEEYKILQLINDNKAKEYKQYLDSIKTKN